MTLTFHKQFFCLLLSRIFTLQKRGSRMGHLLQCSARSIFTLLARFLAYCPSRSLMHHPIWPRQTFPQVRGISYMMLSAHSIRQFLWFFLQPTFLSVFFATLHDWTSRFYGCNSISFQVSHGAACRRDRAHQKKPVEIFAVILAQFYHVLWCGLVYMPQFSENFSFSLQACQTHNASCKSKWQKLIYTAVCIQGKPF